MSAVSDKQKNTFLYVLLLVGVIVGCLPDASMQGISALLGLVALMAAYAIRSKAKEDDLVWHHSTFVIRTIWIWSLFLVIGMVGAALVIQMNADMSAITDLVNSANSGIIPTEGDVDLTMQKFMDTNYDMMLRTTIIWLAPAQVYAVWRSYKGLSRAWLGYRVANLRSWF